MPGFQIPNWGATPDLTGGLSSVPIMSGVTSGMSTPITPMNYGGFSGPTNLPDYAPKIGIGGLGSSGSGLGFNMPTAQLGLSGLATIGNLWAAFQAQKLAKEQFKYTKNVTDTNLTNQIKTYNSGLTDRANNRQIVEGKTADETKAYIDANSLRRYGA